MLIKTGPDYGQADAPLGPSNGAPSTHLRSWMIAPKTGLLAILKYQLLKSLRT